MGGGPSKDMQQMTAREWEGQGKVAIVTGPMGNGIGFHTARWLAERGVHVILAGRDAKRLAECAQQIKAQCKNNVGTVMPADTVHLTELVLDLSSLHSVETFAHNFQELRLPLHMLFNNAGVMATPYKTTADGFEMQIGTNHIGHFYLTKLLMLQLQAGAPSRIINVASMGHKLANMDASKLDQVMRPTSSQYSAWTAYGNSKLANILFARSLQAKYAATGVTAYSLHPGVVATELGRQSFINRTIYKATVFMKTAEEGAGTSIFCATSPEALLHAGGFFDKCAFSTSTSSRAVDDALAEALWVRSEEEIAKWQAQKGAEGAPEGDASAGAPGGAPGGVAENKSQL